MFGPLDGLWCLSRSLQVRNLISTFLISHSKHTLQQIYEYVSSSGGNRLRHGLTFAYFIELLDHVAQNCLYTTRNVHGPYSRVRTMFHVMNSSRGRIKLSKESSEAIINPLTGLDSSEPTSFHKQTKPPIQQNSPSPGPGPGQSQPRSQSVTPTTTTVSKRKISMTPASNTPRRSSSVNIQPSVVSPTPLHSRASFSGSTSTTPHAKRISSPRGNLKSAPDWT